MASHAASRWPQDDPGESPPLLCPVIQTPGAHRPGCWRQAVLTLSLSLSAPSSSLWQWVCPCPGSTSPAREQLTWLVRQSVLCPQRSLPSTRSLGSRSFRHSCRAGWESPVSGRHSISRVWKQQALKEGGAPHMERPLLSPRCSGRGRGGPGGGQHSLDTSATTRAASAWSVRATGHGFYV